MKSKFRLAAYAVAFVTMLFVAAPLWVVIDGISDPTMTFSLILFSSLPFVFMAVFLLSGEMRCKIIAVQFGFSSITVKRYLGLLPSITYEFGGIDGYKTSVLSTTANDYEFLYLMIAGRKKVKLSAFYHKNYPELKQEIIEQGIKNLGVTEYSFFEEIREVFS